MLLLGLVISMVYLIMEKFGPFRGLYCCVKEELFDGIIVAEVFLVFGIAAAVQVFMYSRYIEGASIIKNGSTCS